MAEGFQIRNALISVFNKDGLAPVLKQLVDGGTTFYASGGTAKFIASEGHAVQHVEALTGYPSILGGRVKTLHPKVFGGILARGDNPDDQAQLDAHAIPTFDLVIVDLYTFEKTVADDSASDSDIIEKIDIGGIALIRAAAKNFRYCLCVPDAKYYPELQALLLKGQISEADRRRFAGYAFTRSSAYDTAIRIWTTQSDTTRVLRYGENPQQQAHFEGRLEDCFKQLSGKPLSYNNLIDVEGALRLLADLPENACGVFKHTNPCGIAVRENPLECWQAALDCDPVSAFGGIIVTNQTIDIATAEAIHTHFYEILIAPAFDTDALEFLKSKEKRVLLQYQPHTLPTQLHKTILNGTLVQDADNGLTATTGYEIVTDSKPGDDELDAYRFAELCVKHLKSNAIAIVNNHQMIGAGVGQTSRIDALEQAIAKARRFDFPLEGAILASDGFFPFPDSVETAHNAGITRVMQPGGSMRDQASIDFCNANGITMIFTRNRRFRH